MQLLNYLIIKNNFKSKLKRFELALVLCTEKIESQGGKTLMNKTQISPEIGYMAYFLDTEGNRIALHSQQ